MAAVKLAGFLVLVAMVFAYAHFIGSRVGPVTTGHSHIQYTGGGAAVGGTDVRRPNEGGSDMGGMNMGDMP